MPSVQQVTHARFVDEVFEEGFADVRVALHDDLLQLTTLALTLRPHLDSDDNAILDLHVEGLHALDEQLAEAIADVRAGATVAAVWDLRARMETGLDLLRECNRAYCAVVARMN
jgi:hypothetical protein